MLLAIDTDLLKASLHKDKAQRVVEWLVQKIEDLHFALDKRQVLLREYDEFLSNAPEESLAVQFIKELLSNRTKQTTTLQSNYGSSIEEIVDQFCNEPVEPTLIGMGCHAPQTKKYCILLNDAGERNRGLRTENVRNQICKQLDIQVQFPDTKISFPALEKESKIDRDIWFEEKCQEAIRQVFGFREKRKPTPVNITKKKIDGKEIGDVDIYGLNIEGDVKTVWVGECRLFHSKKNDSVEIEKVEQLKKKLPVVQNYEQTLDREMSIEIVKFIVSNGADLRSESWKLLADIQGKFFCVFLSENWQGDRNWRIEKLEEFEPYQTENLDENGEPVWAGRKIGTHQL